MLTLNTIHHGNCFDLLPLIPDGSVDAVITDPPYETTGLHFDKKGRIDWDLFYAEIRRVLKVNGWFFMFGTLEMCAKAMQYFREKFTYIWVKNNFVFSSQSAVRPYIQHEYIFAFLQKDLDKVSQATFKRDELKTYGHESYSMNESEYNGEWNDSIGATGYKRPAIQDRTWRHGTTVLHYPMQQGFGHCTVKPVALIEYLLGGYTNAGDIILDPFMGSGTTAVACQNTNRNYIGIELHEPYVEIVKQRLTKAINLFTDDKFRNQ